MKDLSTRIDTILGGVAAGLIPVAIFTPVYTVWTIFAWPVPCAAFFIAAAAWSAFLAIHAGSLLRSRDHCLGRPTTTTRAFLEAWRSSAASRVDSFSWLSSRFSCSAMRVDSARRRSHRRPPLLPDAGDLRTDHRLLPRRSDGGRRRRRSLTSQASPRLAGSSPGASPASGGHL